eukprot:5830074-Pyramimonas_sp.AAC.1
MQRVSWLRNSTQARVSHRRLGQLQRHKRCGGPSLARDIAWARCNMCAWYVLANTLPCWSSYFLALHP